MRLLQKKYTVITKNIICKYKIFKSILRKTILERYLRSTNEKFKFLKQSYAKQNLENDMMYLSLEFTSMVINRQESALHKYFSCKLHNI